MTVQDKMRAAISAARNGLNEQARQLLLEVLEADQDQLQAWLWLSYIADDLADKEICFENVLALDPNHVTAQKGLAWVREKLVKAEPVEPEPLSPPAQAGQDVMSHEAAVAAGYLIEDEFDNEWLCPYCAGPTAAADSLCPHCKRALIVRERLSPERSVWLWRGFFLQVYTAFYVLAAGLAYFSAVAKWRGIDNPLAILPYYLGLPLAGSQEEITLALQIMPPFIFWAIVGVALYSLAVMAILYFRAPFGHLFYLFNAGLMIVIGLAGIAFGNLPLIRGIGGLGLILGIGQLAITVNLWQDFTFKETRLQLKLDSNAKTHGALYQSARNYSRLNMWGNAALHLRRAAALQPYQAGYHLALTVAYINIKRYDLAQKSLNDARRLTPNAPEIKQLQQRLNTLLA
jgi:tetratricopeptide (TPR) repeat protein